MTQLRTHFARVQNRNTALYLNAQIHEKIYRQVRRENSSDGVVQQTLTIGTHGLSAVSRVVETAHAVRFRALGQHSTVLATLAHMSPPETVAYLVMAKRHWQRRGRRRARRTTPGHPDEQNRQQ